MLILLTPAGRFSLGQNAVYLGHTTIMNVIKFLTSVKSEFHHVVWPSRDAIIAYTAGVVVLTLLIAYYLGLFDWIFQTGLAAILNR